eukprot:9470319-Lingulodinium_polyedra.AAC.1
MVGKDGRTAYERRRGRRCKLQLAVFGERVWYREVREQKERKEKFATEWKEGVWLGHTRNSNESIIGTKDGVVRAYAVRRQDEAERWRGDIWKQMKGTPQEPVPSKSSL